MRSVTPPPHVEVLLTHYRFSESPPVSSRREQLADSQQRIQRRSFPGEGAGGISRYVLGLLYEPGTLSHTQSAGRLRLPLIFAELCGGAKTARSTLAT